MKSKTKKESSDSSSSSSDRSLKKARVVITYSDIIPMEYIGEVLIKGNKITVNYSDDDGQIVYRGLEKGSGHYVLVAPERHGKATLHCFKDSKIFEGYIEDTYEGRICSAFWRVYLR